MENIVWTYRDEGPLLVFPSKAHATICSVSFCSPPHPLLSPPSLYKHASSIERVLDASALVKHVRMSLFFTIHCALRIVEAFTRFYDVSSRMENMHACKGMDLP